MALGFIRDQYGSASAKQIALDIEYVWNDDKDEDIFATVVN